MKSNKEKYPSSLNKSHMSTDVLYVNEEVHMPLLNVILSNEINLKGKGRTDDHINYVKQIGAYGTFTVTKDISKYTRAKLFNKTGNTAKIFVRFGLIGAENGSADTERNLKEFSLKFFTENGQWDILGNNMPVLCSNDYK